MTTFYTLLLFGFPATLSAVTVALFAIFAVSLVALVGLFMVMGMMNHQPALRLSTSLSHSALGEHVAS